MPVSMTEKLPGLKTVLKTTDFPAFKVEKQEVKNEAQNPQSVYLHQEQKEIDGSNNWVISGKHTYSGQPLMGSDPHLVNLLPSQWYPIDCNMTSIHVQGATIPGSPLSLIGHNFHLGWSVTVTWGDNTDVYLHKINPENPDQYWYEDSWVSFKFLEENIKVRFKSDVAYRVKVTKYGPIISDFSKTIQLLNRFSPDISNQAISLRWVSHEIGKDNQMNSQWELFKAKEIKQAQKFVLDFNGPPLNLLFISQSGDIGYQSIGKYPKRKISLEQYSKVLDGTNADADWDGLVDVQKMPQIMNPERGYLASANNLVLPDELADTHFARLNVFSRPSTRFERIEEVIEGWLKSKKVTVQDIIQLQMDNYNFLACYNLKTMLEVLKSEPLKDKYNKAVSSLQKWDLQMSYNSVEASLFTTWYQKMLDLMIADLKDYPDLYERVSRSLQYKIFAQHFWNQTSESILKQKNQFNVTKWCHGDCAVLLLNALDQAIQYLESQSSQKWGDLHINTYIHKEMNKIPLIKSLFNRESNIEGCDDACVQVSAYDWAGNKNFRGIWGQNYKMVLSPANKWKDSLHIIDTGVCGHFLSSYYFNLNEKFYKGEFLSMGIENGEQYMETILKSK